MGSFETSLLADTTQSSKVILYFFCPNPGINQFSKEHWFLLLEKIFRNEDVWVLGVLIAVGVSLLLDTRAKVYVCIVTHVYLPAYYLSSIYFLKHMSSYK